MKLNNKIIIIVLYYLIYIICKCCAANIIQLSDSSYYNKYIYTINNLNYDYCNFEDGILILVNGTDYQGDPLVGIVGISNIITDVKLLFRTDLSFLLSIKINQVPIGVYDNIQLQVTLPDGILSTVLNQLVCKDIDSTLLNYVIISQISNSYSQLYGGYYGIFKIIGLEYYTQLKALPSNQYLYNISPSKYDISSGQLFLALFKVPPVNPLDQWGVFISTRLSQVTVIFDSPILSNSDNSIQLKYLNNPLASLDSLIFFTPTTQFSKPLFLLSTNNSIQINPITPVFISSPLINQIDFIPISGSFSTRNTINYLMALNANGATGLDISYQYFSTYKYLNYSLMLNEYPYTSSFGGLAGHTDFEGSVLISNQLLNTYDPSKVRTTRITGNSIYRVLEFDYPFGFVLGQSATTYFEVSYPSSQSTPIIFYYLFNFANIQLNSNHFNQTITDTTTLPSLYSYVYSKLNDNQIIFRFILSNPNSIEFLINDQYYHASSCILFNDQVSPTYEVIVDYNKKSSIYLLVQNQYLRFTNYSTGAPYKIPSTLNVTQIIYFESPLSSFNFTDFNIGDIKSIKFLYNDVDTTGESYWNTMYLELNDNSLSKGNPVQVGFYFSNTRIESIYYLYWDSVKLQYSGDFKMPANLLIGSIEYYLSMPTKFITSASLPSIYQLNVYSKDADLMGPVFTTFKKIESMLTVNGVRFGWSFTIQDKVNGFKNGYIVIRGEIDKSIYNITLSPTSPSFKSGDIYEGLYQISIVEGIVGINQSFIVTDVLLQDLQGQTTQFTYGGIKGQQNSLFNPFINFVNTIQNSNFYKVNVTKIAPLTMDSPSDFMQLKAFKVEQQIASSLSPTSNYEITFTVYDDTGLKETQLPYVYITSFSTDTLKFSTVLNSISSDGKTYNFTSNIAIPVSFGYPYPLNINIYGLVNNYGYFNGYSSQTIKSKGFEYKVYSLLPDLKSFATLTEVKYSNGVFNIFGRSLTNLRTINIGGVTLIPNTHSAALFVTYDLDSVVKTNNTVDINIYGTTAQNMNTNSIIFSYTKKQFKVPPVNPLLPPVNPPQQCLGNPQCGGSKQGYCTSNGCVCISPYVGNDCSSKVITIQPPDIDTNKPNTTIQVPVDEIDNSNIQSIITVLGLREVDLLTNQEIIYHPLNSWLYSKQQDSNISLYQSSITQNGIKTNVNVSLEWFTDQKSIIFANQNLTMMPSSMKYTVSLSQYAFTNNFCSLQVIMLAEIQSNNNDVCSNKEFGNTTSGDNSNYIKLQLNKNSFYGRFIKRGIIDSQIRGVENVLLDSSFKSIDSTNNKQQSYIGIVIPRYFDSAIIDPDFSTLLETTSASSFCNNNNNKLSKGAIIGIVVGCVGGAIVITISIILIKKYKYQLRSIQHNIKLKKTTTHDL